MTNNPIRRLEALAGWWRGAAAVRVEAALEHPEHSDEYRRNMERAAEYERRAEEVA